MLSIWWIFPLLGSGENNASEYTVYEREYNNCAISVCWSRLLAAQGSIAEWVSRTIVTHVCNYKWWAGEGRNNNCVRKLSHSQGHHQSGFWSRSGGRNAWAGEWQCERRKKWDDTEIGSYFMSPEICEQWILMHWLAHSALLSYLYSSVELTCDYDT